MEFKIDIYLDNGITYSYNVNSKDELKSNVDYIIKNGYRHKNSEDFTHYSPHKVLKIKSSTISTKYVNKLKDT